MNQVMRKIDGQWVVGVRLKAQAAPRAEECLHSAPILGERVHSHLLPAGFRLAPAVSSRGSRQPRRAAVAGMNRAQEGQNDSK